MSELVVTYRTASHPKAIVQHDRIGLAHRLTTAGDTYDLNVGNPQWSRHDFIVRGESWEYYYGRPPLGTRRGAAYHSAVILHLLDTMSSRRLVYDVTSPDLPPIRVGEVWEPIKEVVREAYVHVDPHIHVHGTEVDPAIAALDYDHTVASLNQRIAQGMWEQSLETQGIEPSLWGMATVAARASVTIEQLMRM